MNSFCRHMNHTNNLKSPVAFCILYEIYWMFHCVHTDPYPMNQYSYNVVRDQLTNHWWWCVPGTSCSPSPLCTIILKISITWSLSFSCLVNQHFIFSPKKPLPTLGLNAISWAVIRFGPSLTGLLKEFHFLKRVCTISLNFGPYFRSNTEIYW